MSNIDLNNKKVSDKVNHPNHYQAPNDPEGHYEVMKIIKAWNLDFFDGSALKYLLRYKSKDGVTDLEKCRNFLNDIIDKEKAKLKK